MARSGGIDRRAEQPVDFVWTIEAKCLPRTDLIKSDDVKLKAEYEHLYLLTAYRVVRGGISFLFKSTLAECIFERNTQNLVTNLENIKFSKTVECIPKKKVSPSNYRFQVSPVR